MRKDDQQLIDRVKQGDLGAFREIVEAHQKKIYYLAYDFTGNHHDAEDILQDVLLKAYRGLRSFRGEAGLGSWLYRITIHACLDRKAKQRPQASLDNPDHVFTLADSHPQHNPERRGGSRLLGDHIQRALQNLTPLERSIFIMRHYHQMPGREVAAALNRAEGTVKNLLFRAIRKLQSQLLPLRESVGQEDRL